MHHRFVETSNVRAFMGALDTLERRGASEACLALVTGEPGHGKSRIGQWYATQQNAVFLRLKTHCTPMWFLTELARELGETAPARKRSLLYWQIMDVLARDPRPIVVDEVEHGLSESAAVIDALRDITDLVETPALLLGREHVEGALRRHKQIWTRVSAVARFGALDDKDVQRCYDDLSEVAAEPEVIAETTRQSEGRIRLVLNAIKTVERIGRAAKRPVTAADIEGLDLTLEHAKRRRGGGESNVRAGR